MNILITASKKKRKRKQREFKKYAISVAGEMRDKVEKTLRKRLKGVEAPNGIEFDPKKVIEKLDNDLDRLENRVFNLIMQNSSTNEEEVDDFMTEE